MVEDGDAEGSLDLAIISKTLFGAWSRSVTVW